MMLKSSSAYSEKTPSNNMALLKSIKFLGKGTKNKAIKVISSPKDQSPFELQSPAFFDEMHSSSQITGNGAETDQGNIVSAFDLSSRQSDCESIAGASVKSETLSFTNFKLFH